MAKADKAAAETKTSKKVKKTKDTTQKRTKWIEKGSALLIKAGVVAGDITADQMAAILKAGVGHVMVGVRGHGSKAEYQRLRGKTDTSNKPEDTK